MSDAATYEGEAEGECYWPPEILGLVCSTMDAAESGGLLTASKGLRATCLSHACSPATLHVTIHNIGSPLLLADLAARANIRGREPSDTLSFHKIGITLCDDFPTDIADLLVRCSQEGLLASVATLAFENCGIALPATAAFAACFPTIRHLRMADCRFRPGSMHNFFNAFPNLESLHLENVLQSGTAFHLGFLGHPKTKLTDLYFRRGTMLVDRLNVHLKRAHAEDEMKPISKDDFARTLPCLRTLHLPWMFGLHVPEHVALVWV